jgi:hypothetical protein
MSDSKLQIERAVTGIELPMDQPIVCDVCHARLREGQPITVGVTRHNDEGVWRMGLLWCPVCAPAPGESNADRLVEGDVGIVSDAREQAHYPVLVRATVVEELIRA